ncbi:hypothetical protein [uncultured Paraglaciecola sp.]|uniref:hypothetical protein n=1 Tax=uncultured Paraglaciecola sp. TaxID=1765024 RepID=UPI0026249EDF|nr:hypothetical protein [uncultured Paraglaciecola sp.]
MSEHLPWFRLYTEIIDDEEVAMLAFEDRWHFVAMMAMKGKGVLDKEYKSEDYRDRLIAKKLGLDVVTFKDVRARLMDAGLIDELCNPSAWEKRQRRSDKDKTGAARQARFRERKEQKKVAKELPKRNSNALRNGPVTRLDTDTDTEKEGKSVTDVTAEPEKVTADKQKQKTDSDSPKGKEKTDYDRLNQVAEVFNENLPALVTAELPQPMNWKRINSIKSIERERPKFQNIRTWEWFFSGVAELDYLSGTGKRKFKGGLDYFLHPDNFASAFEEVQALSEESA